MKSSERILRQFGRSGIGFDRMLREAYNELGGAILLLLHVILEWREVWQ